MNTLRRPLARRLFACSAAVCAAAQVSAEIAPEWVARLPVGSSLSAGIQDMVTDAAGVSYVTGVNGPSYNTDAYTAAIGPDGTKLWEHAYNGTLDWHDQARGICLGPGGIVYVVGNAPGTGKYANVLLLKYDAASGALLNTVQYSSGLFMSEHGAAVATDAAGNVYITGGTVGDGPDVLMLKFDDQGNFQWKHTWDGPAWSPYSQDHGLDVLVGPDGNPVAMIHGVMNSLHPDYVVIKYEAANGSVLWEANWGVNGGDFPADMEIDAIGDVYVTGTGLNFNDMFSTIKLRGTDGQLLWQAYDSNGIDDYGRAVALDGAGGVYITGSVDPDGDRSNFNDNIYTVKRRADDGSLVWSHTYGDNCKGCYDAPSDVRVDPAGNVFVGGGTSSAPYSGDMITLVLDASTGNEIDRGLVYGGSSESAGSGIMCFDASWNLYNGADIGNYDTGEVDISVVKFTSLVGDLYQMSVTNLVGGSDATFSITNATPNQKQYLAYSLKGRGSTFVPQLNVTLDLASPKQAASGRADASGAWETMLHVPGMATGRTVWFQSAEQGRTTPVLDQVVQ
ncbi:MAG: hypothetical protein D8M59_00640 [Planctomycetes bacterium]|nr:hypothetical protein [Planctomycetota bacterium]